MVWVSVSQLMVTLASLTSRSTLPWYCKHFAGAVCLSDTAGKDIDFVVFYQPVL